MVSAFPVDDDVSVLTPPVRATILIVDSEQRPLKTLASVLDQRCYRVIKAASEQEALAALAGEPIELALVDVSPPDDRGLDVLHALRALKSTEQVPVILCSSPLEERGVAAAFAAGADDYVTKPLNLDVTLSRIAAHLELRRTRGLLQESEERFSLATRGANDGWWDWNLLTGRVYFSPRWRQMLGLEKASLGHSIDAWLQLVHPSDAEQVQQQLLRVAPEQGACEFEMRMRHGDGEYRWLLCRGLAHRDEGGQATRLAGSIADVTQAKVTDPLTGLPNRLKMLERTAECLRHCSAENSRPYAVLFLDVDNFKLVNDSLGHEAGDQLLRQLADRLGSCVRGSDLVSGVTAKSSVSRLGGDEFTVLLENLADEQDAERVAARILAALSRPFQLAGRDVFVTASIGISVGRDGRRRPADLLQEADVAMYRAKSAGRARSCVFEPAMLEQATARMTMEHDLRRAIERQEFLLAYQPIYSLETQRIVGVEALVRWRHPTRGLTPPSEFIPLAEETGLIVPIGQIVFRTACAQAAQWQRQFPRDPALLLSVNLSCRQLADDGLIDFIQSVVRETGIDPRSLKLEVTESTLMENPQHVAKLLNQLREMRVQVGLDDFGTGYSCLAMLHRLPLDVLKIDRSFVRDMIESEESAAVARTVMSLAESLNLQVIAEGVETLEQAERLSAMGCPMVQGYYFSPPISAAQLEELLHKTWFSAPPVAESLPAPAPVTVTAGA